MAAIVNTKLTAALWMLGFATLLRQSFSFAGQTFHTWYSIQQQSDVKLYSFLKVGARREWNDKKKSLIFPVPNVSLHISFLFVLSSLSKVSKGQNFCFVRQISGSFILYLPLTPSLTLSPSQEHKPQTVQSYFLGGILIENATWWISSYIILTGFHFLY